jgi:hypothetical protein
MPELGLGDMASTAGAEETRNLVPSREVEDDRPLMVAALVNPAVRRQPRH